MTNPLPHIADDPCPGRVGYTPTYPGPPWIDQCWHCKRPKAEHRGMGECRNWIIIGHRSEYHGNHLHAIPIHACGCDTSD